MRYLGTFRRIPIVVLAAGGLLLAALPSTARVAACAAQSGAVTVALLELYTSEACPNCPAAEQWLARLPEKGLGLDAVVPLALHVDYLNDQGWEDPYAQREFSRRQYRLALMGGSITVYTPQLVLHGREYTGWQREDFVKTVQRINARPPRADLWLDLTRHGSELTIRGKARAQDDADRGDLELYLALYENNLASHVKAGVHRGRTLHHQHVVRRLLGPFALTDSGGLVHETLPLDPSWKAHDLGVAAFVQERASGEVLQALALPVCQ